MIYFEDHPELLEKYQLKHSPLLIVDEKVESIGMPGTDKINDLKKNMDISQIRIPKRVKNHMIPEKIGQEHGLVEVDTTWGSIQPMQGCRKCIYHWGTGSISSQKKGLAHY